MANSKISRLPAAAEPPQPTRCDVLNDLDLRLAEVHGILDLIQTMASTDVGSPTGRLDELCMESLGCALAGAMRQIASIREELHEIDHLAPLVRP